MPSGQFFSVTFFVGGLQLARLGFSIRVSVVVPLGRGPAYSGPMR